MASPKKPPKIESESTCHYCGVRVVQIRIGGQLSWKHFPEKGSRTADLYTWCKREVPKPAFDFSRMATPKEEESNGSG